MLQIIKTSPRENVIERNHQIELIQNLNSIHSSEILNNDDEFLSFGQILIICLFVIISTFSTRLPSYIHPQPHILPSMNDKLRVPTNSANNNSNINNNEQIVMDERWISSKDTLLNFEQSAWSWCGRYNIYDKSSSTSPIMIFYALGQCLTFHDTYNLYSVDNDELIGTFVRYPQFIGWDKCALSVNGNIIATLQEFDHWRLSFDYFYNIYRGYSDDLQNKVDNMTWNDAFSIQMKIMDISTGETIGNASRGFKLQWEYNYDFTVKSGIDMSFLSLLNVAVDVTNHGIRFYQCPFILVLFMIFVV